jgi:hypothetical protein
MEESYVERYSTYVGRGNSVYGWNAQRVSRSQWPTLTRPMEYWGNDNTGQRRTHVLIPPRAARPLPVPRCGHSSSSRNSSSSLAFGRSLLRHAGTLQLWQHGYLVGQDTASSPQYRQDTRQQSRSVKWDSLRVAHLFLLFNSRKTGVLPENRNATCWFLRHKREEISCVLSSMQSTSRMT